MVPMTNAADVVGGGGVAVAVGIDVAVEVGSGAGDRAAVGMATSPGALVGDGLGDEESGDSVGSGTTKGVGAGDGAEIAAVAGI